jgi:ABC-type Zn uptake system ZnuABC Zn-binding protein ZnuA
MDLRAARRRLLLVGIVIAGIVGACGSPPTADGSRIAVVTTSTVFADMIRNVGGDLVTVTSLVPAGTDVHTYQAKPADLQAVAAADLVVMNGLGLDDWLEETIRAASSDAPILRLATDLPSVSDVEFIDDGEGGPPNPHLWMSVVIAEHYIFRISEALKGADPAHADELDASWNAYAQRLIDLDAWVRERMAAVPAANRRVVTFHDALPYFAREYDLTIVGVAVDAPGQDPSAGEIAALIDAIRDNDVRAILAEDQFPTALVDQLGRETGASVVTDLFDDSLGDEPVTSYEAMIRWDVDIISEALR